MTVQKNGQPLGREEVYQLFLVAREQVSTLAHEQGWKGSPLTSAINLLHYWFLGTGRGTKLWPAHRQQVKKIFDELCAQEGLTGLPGQLAIAC